LSSFNVTRRALSLGSRDTVTQWCAVSWTESTIKGSFDPATVRFNPAAGVSIPYTTNPFYTADYVKRGDHIVNTAGTEYNLKTVKPLWRGNEFIGYICQTEEIVKPADRAASSGTWHTDADSVNTDVRQRTYTWLKTYVSYGDGTEQIIFSGFDYPIEYEFVDNDIDILIALEYVSSTPVYDYNHTPYKFEETVALICTAIDTATLTATNLLESYEEAVRGAATGYSTTTSMGSIREITATKPERIDLGGKYAWQTTITLRYIRSNSDYTGSGVSVTWGPSATSSGTFTFPNITYLSSPVKVNNTRLMPPGRMGNVLQKLGMPDAMITVRCDLDAEPSGLTWKRPQTTASKDDVLDWQVFLDIAFTGQYDSDETYQTLNLGWGGTMQVTLEEVTPIESASGRELELVFYTYNSSSGSAYKTWFGISP
jgi:hypothetical protein